MILLDGLYINNSGGKVLLDYLIRQLIYAGMDVFYLLDSRLNGQYDFLPANNRVYLDANLKVRHQFYKKHEKSFTKALCLGNIPPTYHLSIPVYTYFHNTLMLLQPSDYPFRKKIDKRLKGILLKLLRSNTDCFLVQTPQVQELLISNFRLPAEKCLVLPFFDVSGIEMTSFACKDKRHYAYVSDANPHKNHQRLIQAWRELHKAGYQDLHLHLTVTNSYKKILKEISLAINDGVNIHNHGFTNANKLYSQCGFVVYPSLAESFGLGLVEAACAGCEILAADMVYTRNIIEPLAVFDPFSPASIAQCVINNRKAAHLPTVTRIKVQNQIDSLIELLDS